MEYYLAIKKNEIMPYAATWMDLEIIILSEVSQRKTYYMILLICRILEKMIQINLFTKQWDFPGSPVVKTPCFHCRGHRFDPWLEN